MIHIKQLLRESILDDDAETRMDQSARVLLMDKYYLFTLYIDNEDYSRVDISKFLKMPALSKYVVERSKQLNQPIPSKYKNTTTDTDLNEIVFLLLSQPAMGFCENMYAELKRFLKYRWEIKYKTNKRNKLIDVFFYINKNNSVSGEDKITLQFVLKEL